MDYGGDRWDQAEAIVESGDGGFVVAGSSNSFGKGDHDTYIFKIDNDGMPFWSRTHGTPKDDLVRDMIATDDGGFMLVGVTESPNTEGQMEWSGGYIYLLKVNAWGEKIWERTIDYEDNLLQAYSIAQSDDGGFMGVGVVKKKGMGLMSGWEDALSFKVDTSGQLLWIRTTHCEDPTGECGGYRALGWGKCDSRLDWIVEKEDEGFLVGGSRGPTNPCTNTEFGESYIGQNLVFLIDSDGEGVWERPYSDRSSITIATPSCDGGLLITSKESSIHRVDDVGNWIWEADIVELVDASSYWESDFYPNSIIQSGNGTFVVAGNVIIEPFFVTFSPQPYVVKFRDPDLVDVECPEVGLFLTILSIISLCFVWPRNRYDS